MTKAYISRKGLRYFPEIHKNIKQLGRLCRVIGKSRLSVSTVFIVVAVVWMLSPLTASAQQWVLIGRGGIGTDEISYYDSSSVKYLPDNKVQVSVKSALASKGAGWVSTAAVLTCQALNEAYKNVKGDYSYEIEIDEFNCATHEYRTDSETYYDENGNILCKDSTEHGWMKLDLNDKHYLPTLVYQAVCK